MQQNYRLLFENKIGCVANLLNFNGGEREILKTAAWIGLNDMMLSQQDQMSDDEYHLAQWLLVIRIGKNVEMFLAENKKYDMLNEAYSPLGTGGLLGNDVVKGVAANYGKSPAQVLIRWSLQHGFLPLPKSVHSEYIKANAEVFDFEISPEDMVKLDGLHGVAGLANDPDKVNF